MGVAVFVLCAVISCLVASATAGVLFSSLPRTLGVTATINSTSNVAKAGIDQVLVSWWVNQSASPVDSRYKNVQLKLCFPPVSQVDRGWRKSNDDLKMDKTCQFDIIEQPYNSNIKNNTATWTVKKNVPTAKYFVRAYVLDASGTEVAYGQSTNKNKSTNLFSVESISGRHASLDIATAVFSAFSVLSLSGFFLVEKMSARKASQKK